MRLGEAVGLTRAEITDLRHVIRRCASRSMPMSTSPAAPVAGGGVLVLTELFAPAIHQQRLATWPGALPAGSTPRPAAISATASARPRDVEQAWRSRSTISAAATMQERALEILQFKLDILWAMNDAMAQGGDQVGREPT